MINSLMSRMNAADNLSVQQLHQAVADGTLPAYVGVPMIQDKMKQQQQAMAMQQPMQQPPIADQIMAASAPRRMPRREVMPQENQLESQVAQAPAQGIETAQSNLPTQMAEGGIIGYAGGGMDDQTEDDELEQLYGSGSDNDLIQAIAARGRGSDVHPSAAIQMRPESESIGFGKGHKYHDYVVKEAERQGLDPAIALHALYRETGGLKNPESARSKAGAIGVMQLMPATAKSLGVDPTDPMQNIQGGVTYLKQMQDKYQNPQLTLMAYNAGPGRVDKALRHPQGLASLPAETRNYSEGGIAHFKKGDEIKENYDAGSQADDQSMGDPVDDNAYLQRSRGLVQGVKDIGTAFTTPKNYDLYDLYQRNIGQPFSKFAHDYANETKEEQAARFNAASNARKNVSFTDTSAPAPINPVVATPSTNPSPVAPSATTVAPAATPAPAPSPAPVPAPVPALPEKKPAGIDQLDYNQMLAQNLKDIAAQRAESKKDREMNKYLALMQAGFGMMGGTSPYAAVNIGQGAEKGIGAYASLNQASSKEANELLAQQNALYKYGSAAKAAEERNRIYGEIAGNKPDQYDVISSKIEKDLSINPTIRSLNARMAADQKNGMLTAESERKYLEAIDAETAKIYKQHNREYTPPKMDTITTPTKPKEPGFLSRINPFTSSTPAPSTLSSDQQALLDKYK